MFVGVVFPVVEIWVIILRCACTSDKIPYKDIKRFDFVLMFLTFCQRFTIEQFVVRWGGGVKSEPTQL